MPYHPTESEVHTHLEGVELEDIIADVDLSAEIKKPVSVLDGEAEFALWRIIKTRAVLRIKHSHDLVRYGRLLGSKLKLPTDATKPMELDFLGAHDDGLFIVELKVKKGAERNAFSELFAYSHYIAEAFAGSGRRDITNVLIAKLDNKITRHAFLYDLIVTGRDLIVYQPTWTESLDDLRLDLYIPSDEDFQHFTNQLLSHETMACVVGSFHDLGGWYDSEERDGELDSWTVKHLSAVSSYAAQLMEAEGLHGFCFVRKPWDSIPLYYRNSLVLCALNPFRVAQPERADVIVKQLAQEERSLFLEAPESGFSGRLIAIAQQAISDTLQEGVQASIELPQWSAMVTNMVETVFTHNFAFRPSGLLRESYVTFLNEIYSANATGALNEDVSTIKSNEIFNWLRAWDFMESCGLSK